MLRFAEDAIAGRWLQELLWPWGPAGLLVGSLVPEGYAAYARILHWMDRVEFVGDRRVETRVRWREVWGDAAERVEFDRGAPLGGSRPFETSGPAEGHLRMEEAKALTPILERHTGSPKRCWFAEWHGYGDLHPGSHTVLAATLGEPASAPGCGFPEPPPGVDMPLLTLPHREYLVYTGAVRDVLEFVFHDVFRTPTIWWPEDRAWVVHSEIDLASTYVAGTAGLVARILSDDVLEAIPVALRDRLSPG